MSGIEIAGGVLMIILSGFICLFVSLQEGTRGGGIGAITGGAEPDSFFSKNPGRTKNIMLYRATRFVAIAFFVITLLVQAANIYL